MTNDDIPVRGQGQGAGDQDLAQDTDDQRADLAGGPTQEAGGGRRVREGGGPTLAIEAVAADRETDGRRKSPERSPRRPPKATAVPGGLAASVGDTGGAAVHPDPPGENCPGLRPPGDTRRRKRRTRIGKRIATEKGGRRGTGAERKENDPTVKRRRVKTKNEIETASLTVRKETLR